MFDRQVIHDGNYEGKNDGKDSSITQKELDLDLVAIGRQ